MLALIRAVRSQRRRAAAAPLPETRLAAAERHLARGRREEARRLAMEVAAEVRGAPRLLNRVGDLFVRLDAGDSAVACYFAAADHHLEDGFEAKATALYRKILRLDPDHVVARARLAGLYHRQGLAAEAARYGPATWVAAG